MDLQEIDKVQKLLEKAVNKLERLKTSDERDLYRDSVKTVIADGFLKFPDLKTQLAFTEVLRRSVQPEAFTIYYGDYIDDHRLAFTIKLLHHFDDYYYEKGPCDWFFYDYSRKEIDIRALGSGSNEKFLKDLEDHFNNPREWNADEAVEYFMGLVFYSAADGSLKLPSQKAKFSRSRALIQ